jgi:hypothetical protein
MKKTRSRKSRDTVPLTDDIITWALANLTTGGDRGKGKFLGSGERPESHVKS